MSFSETFSPPVVLKFADGSECQFRRVLMDDWGKVCAAIKAERIAAANQVIAVDKTMDTSQKFLARRRVADEEVDFYEAMTRCTRTIGGVKRLLTAMLVPGGKLIDEVFAQSAPQDLMDLAGLIAYKPVEWPSAAPLEASVEGETGSSTPPESGTSTDATPAE